MPGMARIVNPDSQDAADLWTYTVLTYCVHMMADCLQV